MSLATNQRLLQQLAATGQLGLTAEQQENRNLAGQIARQVQREGEEPSILDRGKNILGRTFDVLSRPLYAVAEASQDVVEGQNPVEGLWEGLSGQEKTTFSDVLESAGVENKFVRGVGGFALDVLADPLTYLTGGISRGISKELAETQTAKQAAKFIARSDPWYSEVAKKARREAVKQAVSQGRKLSKAEQVKVGQDAIHEAARTMQDKFITSLREKNPGTFDVKFMGRPVAKSERIFKIGSKAFGRGTIFKVGNKEFKGLAGTQVGNAINKAFRPSATFVAGTNALKRSVESQGAANAERFLLSIHSILRGTTEPERERLYHALQDGFDFGDELSENGQKLNDILEYFKHLRETMFDVELGTGLRHESDFVENWTPFSFDETINSPALVNKFLEARKKEIKGIKDFNKKSVEEIEPMISSFTAEVAKQRGLIPIEDVGRVFADGILKSFREQGRARIIKGVGREFGVVLGERGAGKAQALGLREANLSGRFKNILPEGTYFPKEIARTLDQMERVHYDEAAGSALRNMYDSVLGTLKFGQTVINPGHHIRNALSDINLNFLDGVTNPAVYKTSFDILRGVKPITEQILNFEDVVSKPLKNTPSNTSIVAVQVGNLQPLSATRIYDLFVAYGGKSGYYRSEFATSRFGIVEKLRQVSETREDWTRLAHFIDALQKEGKNAKSIIALEAAASRAGQRVRKFNIDYGDLTPFEQRTMRRVVPFYTWMRKASPLMVETLFMRPGRQLVVPKSVQAIQEMLGTEEPTGAFGINFIPEYMRNAMSVNLVGEGQGRNGVYWNPEAIFPVMGLNEFFGRGPADVIRNQLAGLTPALRAPVEQITDFNFFKGRPDQASNWQYGVTQVPVGRLISQALSGDLTPMRFGSWLTGSGVSELTQGQIAGELRRQEDIIQRIARARREIEESQGGNR